MLVMGHGVQPVKLGDMYCSGWQQMSYVSKPQIRVHWISSCEKNRVIGMVASIRGGALVDEFANHTKLSRLHERYSYCNGNTYGYDFTGRILPELPIKPFMNPHFSIN